MHRRIIAAFASFVFFCAGLLSASGPSPSSIMDMVGVQSVNTDDGVSLAESVIDDLRPSVLADPVQGLSALDFFPPPVSAVLPDERGLVRPSVGAASRLRPHPFLAAALRPPSLLG